MVATLFRPLREMAVLRSLEASNCALELPEDISYCGRDLDAFRNRIAKTLRLASFIVWFYIF